MAISARALTPKINAFIGMMSLAVAMGIGRFALTPVLPAMLSDGQLTIQAAGWLAAANYLGYLIGALTASRLRVSAPLLAGLSLAAIACSTAAMSLPGLPLWMILRFTAGVLSAYVFVATSVWCLGMLAKHSRQDLAPYVYSGVGIGIALAGGYSFVAVASALAPDRMWLHLGLMAAALAIPVCAGLYVVDIHHLPQAQNSSPRHVLPHGTRGLVLCYGVMGFGYIIPATFLPALGHSVIEDPKLFGLAWPIFGITAALSTVLAGKWIQRSGRLNVWSRCQFAMGVGAILPSLWLNGWTILSSAILVGGTFMVITLVGVQELRARVSWNAGAWVGHLTAAFAIGQIAGPVFASVLSTHPSYAQAALPVALQLAAATLFCTSAWLWRLDYQTSRPKELQRVHNEI
jgi:MFS family permease